METSSGTAVTPADITEAVLRNAAADRVQLLHPEHGKSAHTVERTVYAAVRCAVLDAVSDRSGTLRFSDLAAEVERRTPAGLWTRRSVGWWTTAVKLDLEARGEIARVPGVCPQLLQLATDAHVVPSPI